MTGGVIALTLLFVFLTLETNTALGQFVPQFSILEAPYIWRDEKHMRRVMTSPIMDEMSALLVAKRQMRVVGATLQMFLDGALLATATDATGRRLPVAELDTIVSRLKVGLGVSPEAVTADPNAGPMARAFVAYERAVTASGEVEALN